MSKPPPTSQPKTSIPGPQIQQPTNTKTTPPQSSPPPPLLPSQPTTLHPHPHYPHTLFFYGTLQSPTALQSITRPPSPLPALEDAYIHCGSDLRLWGGKHPALIPNPDSKSIIEEKLWRVGEGAGFGAQEWARLRRYEGGKYEVGEYVVRVGGGEGDGSGDGVRGEGIGSGGVGGDAKAVVFKWAGRDAGSEELS